jgi:hypothetical protein
MLTGWLHDTVVQMGPIAYAITATLSTLALAALLLFCFTRLRYLRLVEDTPTALIRSAAQGFVELEGKARPLRDKPLTSPLRAVPCVWWSYRIEEFDGDVDVDADPVGLLAGLVFLILHVLQIRPSGRVVESGKSNEPFLIHDSTGACIVDPTAAEILEARTEVWTLGSRRYEESVIAAGSPLYALGLFRTPRDHAVALERREVGALISAWKLDRLKLAERFDANRDGALDQAEWTAAWDAAAAEVRRQRAAREPAPELHVLCHPGDRRPFVLSVLGQGRLASRFWFQSVTSLLASGIVVTLLVWSLRVRDLI